MLSELACLTVRDFIWSLRPDKGVATLIMMLWLLLWVADRWISEVWARNFCVAWFGLKWLQLAEKKEIYPRSNV